jgi:YidC/Oxa1 family membrane protein insertase
MLLTFFSLGLSLVFRTNGTPSLGWGDTIAFLSLPLFLVISQFVSMQLMQPKTDDPAQQQSNFILKLLPLMIGWFSLNVPAALCIYWVTNNVITTATSLIIRNTFKAEPVTLASSSSSSGSAAARVASEAPTIFAPPREKPVGFGGGFTPPGVKTLTATDAEIVEDEEDEDEDEDAAVEEQEEESVTPSADSEVGSRKKKSGGKRRKKRKT